MTSGVADGEKHRDVPAPGFVERIRMPRAPIDGVFGVLEKVGARLLG
jgi:hypothetical protein